MSNHPGEAATAAREQETEQTQTPNAEATTQGLQSTAVEQPTGHTASAEPQAELTQPTPSSEAPAQPVAWPATPPPTGGPDEGVANSANLEAATAAQEATRREFEPRPDVSDQGFQELLPKLLKHFHNNREQLARAIGLHRSTVDRWLNGKSRPNNSTVLRMRRVAQERHID